MTKTHPVIRSQSNTITSGSAKGQYDHQERDEQHPSGHARGPRPDSFQVNEGLDAQCY